MYHECGVFDARRAAGALVAADDAAATRSEPIGQLLLPLCEQSARGASSFWRCSFVPDDDKRSAS